MSAPFNPPSVEGKPHVPEWNAPGTTEMELDWASLHTIELSLLDSPDPKVVQDLVELTKTAIKEDGFLYLADYGISLDQLHRQFALAQYTHANITDADKERLLWNPAAGTFAGFKPRYGWKRERGAFDGIEQFNLYAREFSDPESNTPACIHPFLDEIEAFCNYLTFSVNRRLLKLLSRVLELPDDYLWDNIQSHSGPVGDGYFRHALFYPLLGEDRERQKDIRLDGHTDYGTTTLLFSVPVTALHIWSKKNKWQPVKYKPGALVVNIGDVLEIISGGHFKATRHKVANVPSDQEHLQRLSIVQFNACVGSLRVSPIADSPLIQREGFVLDQGVFKEYMAVMDRGLPVPTSREWRELQVSKVQHGISHTLDTYRTVELNGVTYTEETIHGVRKLVPA